MINHFAAASRELDQALSEALAVRYPLYLHLSRLEAALRETDASTFEEAAASAIVTAFGWSASQRRNEIDRFVAALGRFWPDAATRRERMQDLCDHAQSPLPPWA